MGTLRDFSVRVNRIAAAIPQGANLVKRQVAAAVLQPLVTATPVGNPTLWNPQAQRMKRPGYAGGRARANWFVSLGSPSDLTTEDIDPAGSRTIERGNSTIAGSVPGEAVVITNNLPYIVPLNEGHSHQAPVGFVERAVQQGIAKLAELRVLDV